MTRTVGLVSFLAAVSLVAYLLTVHERTTDPSAEAAEAQAESHAATASFQAAAPVLQAWHAEHGTYAGAALPATYGVTLVRTGRDSYCLQAGSGAAAQHVVGPGGAPAAGPCAPA